MAVKARYELPYDIYQRLCMCTSFYEDCFPLYSASGVNACTLSHVAFLILCISKGGMGMHWGQPAEPDYAEC